MPATKGHGIVSGMSSSCHWFSIIKIMSDVQLLILNKEPGEGFSPKSGTLTPRQLLANYSYLHTQQG